MLRLLARVIGVGIETADMLVQEVLSRNMRDHEQTARIEAGSVSLPRNAGWLDEFRGEILAFPAGRYTDQVDAFSQALKRAFNRRGGVVSWGFVNGLY